MRIRKEWAEALNAVTPNGNSTMLADFLKQSMEAYPPQNPRYQTWPAYGQSLMLSVAVADGLARIEAEYNVSAAAPPKVTICRPQRCSQGPFETPLVTDINSIIWNGTVQEGKAYSDENFKLGFNASSDPSQQIL